MNNAKKPKAKNKPPQPQDFTNYYVYKSALAEYNEEQYNEFLDKCNNGECVFIEKEIISQEREKGNKEFEKLNEVK